MNNIKLIIILAVMAATSLGVGVINAQTQASSSSRTLKDNRRTVNSDQRVLSLRSKAEKEIQRRIKTLSDLAERVGQIKKIDQRQKDLLISQIQEQIKNFESLNVKVTNDSDYASLKGDAQEINASYRAFGLMLPKIQIIATSDKLETTSESVSTIAAKLEVRIDSAKSQGENVEQLSQALLDMKDKISDTKNQTLNARNLVIPLTSEGYPQNKNVLQSARGYLQTGYEDLRAARKDAELIIEGLVQLSSVSNPTPSAASSSGRQVKINGL